MTVDTIKNQVKKFIIEKFLLGDSEKLKEDMSFLEQGILDSTGVLELVGFLEQTYAIKVEDDEMLPENLDSLNNIMSYIQKKLLNKSTASV